MNLTQIADKANREKDRQQKAHDMFEANKVLENPNLLPMLAAVASKGFYSVSLTEIITDYDRFSSETTTFANVVNRVLKQYGVKYDRRTRKFVW